MGMCGGVYLFAQHSRLWSHSLRNHPVDKDDSMLLFSSHEGWGPIVSSAIELRHGPSDCTADFIPHVPPCCFVTFAELF